MDEQRIDSVEIMDVVEKAYGLLWRDTYHSEKACKARKLLRSIITTEGQHRCITYACQRYGAVSDHEALRDFP